MLLVLVFTLAMQRPWQAKPTTFSASMRFNVGIQPERVPGVYTFDRYYTMLTSEYLVDDLGEIVRSQVFAQEVSKRLAEKGIVVPAGAIGASTQPGKLHRILTVNVGWPKQEEIGAIAEAIVATLTESSADFFSQFSADEADIRLIDPPAVGAVGRPARRATRPAAAPAPGAVCGDRVGLSGGLPGHFGAGSHGFGASRFGGSWRGAEVMRVRRAIHNHIK